MIFLARVAHDDGKHDQKEKELRRRFRWFLVGRARGEVGGGALSIYSRLRAETLGTSRLAYGLHDTEQKRCPWSFALY